MSFGLEPSFGLYYWKRTRMKGNSEYEYYFIVPNIIRKMFKELNINLPMKSDTILDDWQGSKGKIIAKIIDDNKEKLPVQVKDQTEINPLDKLEMMIGIQKWVDSSMSTTYTLPITTKVEQVEELIYKAWKNNVKSIAAFPDKEMYGIISHIPFFDLAKNLLSKGIAIYTKYNFTDEEVKLLNIRPQEVKTQFFKPPERKVKVDADIYTVIINKEKYIIVIGLDNGIPIETFGGKIPSLLDFNFKNRKGMIEKIKSGHYKLYIEDGNEYLEIDNFGKMFKPVEQLLFRKTSLELKYRIPVESIIDTLTKSTDSMFSSPSALARILKKYINDKVINGKKCPQCGNTEWNYTDGCPVCTQCGYSKCD